MFCTNCGTRNEPASNYCVQCQALLEKSAATAQNLQTGYNYNQGGYTNYGGYNNQVNTDALEKPITVGEWLITFLLLLIPIANIVLIFVWAFSGTAPKSKSNFFKAQLIIMAIGIGLSIILALFLPLLFFALY